MSKTINIVLPIEVPDGATHYFGDLLNHPVFVKTTFVGVAGEHWWTFDPTRSEWILMSHYPPHWLKKIPTK
jgi:hypothetical protein